VYVNVRGGERRASVARHAPFSASSHTRSHSWELRSTCVAVLACDICGEELEMSTAVSTERTRALTFTDLLPLFELGVALAPGPVLISTLEDSRGLGRTWFHEHICPQPLHQQ
jgi:hypothetical protein